MSLITCPVFFLAQRFPEKTALVFDDETYTYLDFHHNILRAQMYLNAHIKQSHSIVVFPALTLPETVFLYWAIRRCGCIASPINPKQFSVQKLKANTFFKEAVFIENLHAIFKQSVLEFDAQAVFSWPLKQWATAMFTSGSSALPKLALHTYEQHHFNALGVIEALSIRHDSRIWVNLPLFHVSGLALLHRSVLTGATLVFSQHKTIDALETYNLTHISMVPTQAVRALKCDRFNRTVFESLSHILLGGAPVSEFLIRHLKERGFDVFESYGLTELSSTLTINHNLLHFREAILDENGQVLVKGKPLFEGYVSGEFVHLPLTMDGWFETKDQGYFDSSKKLIIKGRQDRLIISGGENIQPEEIESCLLECSDVERAYVTGVPHHEFGERPVAVIKTVSGNPCDPDQLKHELLLRLPPFKCPDFFVAWPLWLQDEKIPQQPLKDWVKTIIEVKP